MRSMYSFGRYLLSRVEEMNEWKCLSNFGFIRERYLSRFTDEEATIFDEQSRNLSLIHPSSGFVHTIPMKSYPVSLPSLSLLMAALLRRRVINWSKMGYGTPEASSM